MSTVFKHLFRKKSDKKNKQKQNAKSKPKKTKTKYILSEEEVAELIIHEDRIEKSVANSTHFLRVSQILIVIILA